MALTHEKEVLVASSIALVGTLILEGITGQQTEPLIDALEGITHILAEFSEEVRNEAVEVLFALPAEA